MTSIASGVIILVAAIVAQFVLPDFYVALFNYVGLSALVCMGLVLLTGVAGITSFGQAAFAGIGAYATAYLSARMGISPWVGLLSGLVLTVAASAFIGAITLGLSGHYLPLSTIAWSVALYFYIGNIDALGGHTGISGIPPISLFGFVLDSHREFIIVIWLVIAVFFVLISNLLGGRVGRAVRGLRSGAILVESFGISAKRMRMIAFVYAAVLASLSGWLYAHLLNFVNPTPFSIVAGVKYLFMTVVGGVGHLAGAILGASIFTFLQNSLQDLAEKISVGAADFEIVVWGILMIGLLQIMPEGIFPHLATRMSRPRKRAPGNDPHALLPTQRGGEKQMVTLKVDALSKNFGGLAAVSNLSFEVRTGEILGLIGPNGAGKSTTFEMIAGVLSPSLGEVLLNAERISGLPLLDVAKRGVARTFQHVRLVRNMSVIENVMIGGYLRGRGGIIAGSLCLDREEERAFRAEAEKQLTRVGLLGVANELTGNLALGQQRLVEIARALSMDPVVLLLDEPAAGLRYLEKEALALLLKRLRGEGIAVTIIEHDMDFLMNLVDRVVVMNFGIKIAEGKPQEVRTHKEVLDAYLGVAA